MTGIDILLTEAPLAVGFGAAGLAGQLAWPLFRRRGHILALQLAIASSYATQYALMGQWSGTGVCTVGAAQTLVALIAGERAWLRKLGLGFLPVVGLVGYVTWSGLPSAFALTACCLVMLGRMQRDTLRMRAMMLSASPFGIGYDLTVGAAPALAGAILSALIGLAAFRREWRARQGRPARPALAA